MLGAVAPCFSLSSFAGGARWNELNPETSGIVEQTLPEGEQFYLFLSCLFSPVARFCSSILGYQLHRFAYRLNVASAFVQKRFSHYYSGEKQGKKSRCG